SARLQPAACISSSSASNRGRSASISTSSERARARRSTYRWEVGLSGASCGLTILTQALRLVRRRDGVDQRIQGAVQDGRQVVQRQANAMVGDPVLREVVGPDLLGALRTANH